MFKFFRKIRMDLLQKKKIGKYLGYAVGEIVLVVIGILIALQLNNLNEKRKDAKKLKTVLLAVRKDLVKDSISIYNDLEYSNKEITHDSLLLEELKESDTNLDSIVSMFKYKFRNNFIARLNYNTSTFENLKFTGSFELVSDSLRNSLSVHYNFQEYRENINVLLNEQYQEYLAKFGEKFPGFIDSSINTNLTKIFWEGVSKKDLGIQFIRLLKWRHLLWWSYGKEMKLMLESTRSQIQLIDQELNKM